MFVVATLDEQQVTKLRQFETQKNIQVVAFSDIPMNPADVDGETLDELQRLESDLGCCLLVLEP